MKKLYSSILVFILIVSIALPTKAQTFRDIKKNSYSYSDVEFLVERGILDQGTNLGALQPATRQDVVVMLAKALNFDNTPVYTDFADIPVNHRYSGYINNATKAGIVLGMPDGTFQPNQQVTRGQMAAFISRAFKLQSGTVAFRDLSKNHYAYDSVKALVAAGITTGYPDGTFKANETLNKEQLAVFVARAIRHVETGTTGVNKMEELKQVKEYASMGTTPNSPKIKIGDHPEKVIETYGQSTSGWGMRTYYVLQYSKFGALYFGDPVETDEDGQHSIYNSQTEISHILSSLSRPYTINELELVFGENYSRGYDYVPHILSVKYEIGDYALHFDAIEGVGPEDVDTVSLSELTFQEYSISGK